MDNYIKNNKNIKLKPITKCININKEEYYCIYGHNYDDKNYICYKYISPYINVYDFLDEIEDSYFYIKDIKEIDLFINPKEDFRDEIIKGSMRLNKIKK